MVSICRVTQAYAVFIENPGTGELHNRTALMTGLGMLDSIGPGCACWPPSPFTPLPRCNRSQTHSPPTPRPCLAGPACASAGGGAGSEHAQRRRWHGPPCSHDCRALTPEQQASGDRRWVRFDVDYCQYGSDMVRTPGHQGALACTTGSQTVIEPACPLQGSWGPSECSTPEVLSVVSLRLKCSLRLPS